jgi:hypothetical protein
LGSILLSMRAQRKRKTWMRTRASTHVDMDVDLDLDVDANIDVEEDVQREFACFGRPTPTCPIVRSSGDAAC